MPKYAYRAKDTTFKIVEGTIEAETANAAITRLATRGIYPLSFTEVSSAALPASAAAMQRRVPSQPLAYMSRQLADLLGGGVSLFNALSLLSNQTEHRLLRGVITQVSQTVRDGQAFSEALAQHPDIFSPLYVSMVRAGEVGGGLDGVLVRLADLLDAESELKSRIASALVYPCVVLAIGLVTIGVLLIYVVPKLTVLFTETGQLLPLPTRILLAISGSLSQWWWLWLLGLVAVGWGARIFLRSAAGRAAVQHFLRRLPLAGSLIQKIQTARFTRNLGVMVGQGVPVLQALSVASSTMSHGPLQEATRRVQEAVQDGMSLAQALGSSGQFPVFVSNMVAVGEESGTLEAALLKVATSYERDTERTLRVLTTVLEPVMIVLVGLIVMFIVISMLLPIFQLGLVAQ